jgi:ABC-type thiamin/hydroxymethylpyrimidine transport system permease subunit
MYYFVAAGFNNIFLYFAVLPRIWSEHRAPLACRSFVVQVAFHGLWIRSESPFFGAILD